ncbi:MAG: hypothetical protein H6876_06290 [Hyphomicrobiaceae bacterium]|nr:hypothetical protein [Hyphomicrobiaceae bacterium]
MEVSYGTLTALYKLGAARVHEQLNILADEFSHGDPKAFINKTGFQEVQDFLRSKAHRVAKRRPVFKRTAYLPDDHEIWIDLSQELDGTCIRITANGWSTEEPLQPFFVRFPTQRPLPTPEACDDGYAAFKRILPPGITDEHAKLLLGAQLACLVPTNFAASFSYPIVILTGEAGSGKSTLAKFIKTLLDNEVTTTAAKPAKIDDLFVSAQTSHLLSYDNVDFIKGSLSDAVCQLSTGSAIVKRRLYTDADLTILRAHCPVMFNGISPDIPRQDLIDRSIHIHLARISAVDGYDPDAVNQTHADLPLVMGYLCDLLSRALRNYATTRLAQAPRLSLLAKIATAAEPFGIDTPYVDLLVANQHEALIATQDNDLVIAALFQLLEHAPSWTGTFKSLLAALTARADDATARSPEWPTSPRKLALHLQQNARLLHEQGLEITKGRKTEHGRVVTILRRTTNTPDAPSIPFR